MSISPSDLFELVEAYASFGNHRTGSATDKRTADWFAGLLEDLGACVEKQPFSFDSYESNATLLSVGEPIDSLPLYYSYAGTCISRNLSIQRLQLDHEDGAADPIPDLCSQAKTDGFDALVLATGTSSDSLIANNRDSTGIVDIPVMLIAGRDYDRVSKGTADLTFSASIAEKRSHNVIARFGNRTAAERIVLTTPISGWFGCAGERGTGIAILIGLVETLRHDHSFTVIGASGHELMYLGGENAAEAFPGNPDLVLHLGSCIATLEGSLDAVLHAPNGTVDSVRTHLAPLSVKFRVPDHPGEKDEWVGESRCWAGRAKSMLSIAGSSPDFHTPEDTPDRATSPKQLGLALQCIKTALDRLLPARSR